MLTAPLEPMILSFGDKPPYSYVKNETLRKIAVAMDQAGNFVVVWNGREETVNSNNHPTYMQRFDSHGNVIDTSPTKVNPVVVSPEQTTVMSDPSIAMNADGGFAITRSFNRQLGSIEGKIDTYDNKNCDTP